MEVRPIPAPTQGYLHLPPHPGHSSGQLLWEGSRRPLGAPAPWAHFGSLTLLVLHASGLAEKTPEPWLGMGLCAFGRMGLSGCFACVNPPPACWCPALPASPHICPVSVHSALGQHDPSGTFSYRIPHQRQLSGRQPPAGLHPLGEQ